MYKILIKPNASQKYYQPYKTLVGSDMIEYSAETVEELSETYTELIKKYPTEQLKAIQELEPEILITIVD